MNPEPNPHEITFSLWMTNIRLLASLLSPTSATAFISDVERASEKPQPFSGMSTTLACQRGVEALMRSSDVVVLAPVDATVMPAHGALVYVEREFTFSGVNAAFETRGKIRFSTELDESGITLSGGFGIEHLLNSTASSRLNGRANVSLLGHVVETSASDKMIRVHPIMFGDKVLSSEYRSGWWDPLSLEVSPEDVDEFGLSGPRRLTSAIGYDLGLMKRISENEIKASLAKILGEPHVPKDWGGEKSDLFTTNIHVNGRQRRAAFLLKGPARHAPMTIAHLGKNGDQIDRLMTEPADLFVVQHSHAISTAVRNMLANYALVKSMKQNRVSYMFLDALETYRILNVASLLPAQ